MDIKRAFDLISTIIFTPVVIPILFSIYLLVIITSGTPGFFRQQRPGLNSIPFTLYKFRTMTEEKNSDGRMLPDKIRLTGFGRILRKYSLDELPELYNVLRGDMSLVGPRPLLMEYLDLYSNKQARRHEVRPGITGLAQVRGRNTLSWNEKFELDVWYVDNHTLWLDIKILLTTIKKVLTSEGISAEGEATTKYFMGNKDA